MFILKSDAEQVRALRLHWVRPIGPAAIAAACAAMRKREPKTAIGKRRALEDWASFIA